jgi:hypothetical protein
MLCSLHKHFSFSVLAIGSISLLSACGGVGVITNTANSTSTAANTNSNTNTFSTNVNSAPNTSAMDLPEPTAYKAVVRLALQTMGENQNASMPSLSAIVARSGADRVMEFTLPTNEKFIYLEKGNSKYVVLPTRKQYAELTSDALGFEVRRLMMPEQMVNQLKGVPGVSKAGEEMLNGRPVIRYTYQTATNTGTQAGTVATESYFLIDKETNLPVRSEIVSQSSSGGNVQGIKGLRLVTEMSDIITTPDPNLFTLPTDYQKIDPEQVKAQANLLFNAAAAIIGQMINQTNASPAPASTGTPAANR